MLHALLPLILVAGSWAAPPMVTIPAGELKPFWISPSEKDGEVPPLKIVAFQVMSRPVTNSDFIQFLNKNPEWRKSKVKRVFAEQGYLDQFASDLEVKKGVRLNAPVNFVSWFAAQAYCESLEMRLPTLAEWEYIGIASETKADASSDAEFLNRILEWYAEPRSGEGLPSTGGRGPNFYGVRDLHGLVWEWTEDFNSSLVTGEGRTDGSLNRNLFCGAGAMSGGNKENYAAYMRFAHRSSLKGNSTSWNLGFRCVKGESK